MNDRLAGRLLAQAGDASRDSLQGHLIAQVLWFIWIAVSGNGGFLPAIGPARDLKMGAHTD
jgi:hypothetical protein